MSPVPPIPAELWGQVPPAAQTAILAQAQHYEEQLRALEGQVYKLLRRRGRTRSAASRGYEAPSTTDTDPSACDWLADLVRQSPRNFGKPRSTWTIRLWAEVCFEVG